MTEEALPFVLVDIGPERYEELLELWDEGGLPVRREGRDSPAAFAHQLALGQQRAIGLLDPSGRLVAATVLTHDGRKGWINRLAVDPPHRRRGLARRLVDEAERWFAQELGLEVWAALIEGYNKESQALFDALGFHTLDVVYVSKRTRPES
jgi:N-acetylglutamate synthase